MGSILGRKCWQVNSKEHQDGRDSNHCKLTLQASSLHVISQKLPSSMEFLLKGSGLVFVEGLLLSRFHRFFFSFNLNQSPLGRYYYQVHFTHEETKLRDGKLLTQSNRN